MRVKADDFAASVTGLLDDFAEGVSDGVERAVNETAERALKVVKKLSPRRKGRYARSWRVNSEKTGVMGKKTNVTIHNRKYYRLTHLLENGHQKAGGGRVEGTPHIRPAEELAVELLPELVREAVEEAAK